MKPFLSRSKPASNSDLCHFNPDSSLKVYLRRDPTSPKDDLLIGSDPAIAGSPSLSSSTQPKTILRSRVTDWLSERAALTLHDVIPRHKSGSRSMHQTINGFNLFLGLGFPFFSPLRFSAKKKRAFSLIELILVIAILALLGGAVAGILQGSVASAITLTEVSNRQSQIQSFLQLVNSSFRNLGSETTFLAQKNAAVDQSNLFLMFNHSTQLFSWHRDQSKYPAKVLTWWPNDKGVLSIGILEYKRYFKLLNSTDENFSPAGWAHKIELLGDIKSVSWRFWNQQTKKWTDDWRNPTQRPSGAELTLQTAESTHPTIHFFYIPPIQIQIDFAPPPPNPPPATEPAP